MNKETVKLEIYAGTVEESLWAVQFCFFYDKEKWEEMTKNQQIIEIEKEVAKCVSVEQAMIENGPDFYRFEVVTEIGNQKKSVKYDVLKKLYSRLYSWQKKELMMIYANTLVEWNLKWADSEKEEVCNRQ
ncbi:TPA: hypothetical protein R4346_001628 [Pasteurella multocida]|uniref:hypothetical protein n=1 Tax=Pasteurella multocida TaxID=747 RepID=UPI0029449275|nr:hypothetical protein [Pasteurella multocida]MEB3481096.1 hypothetical protein [Pasteurella multocida]HDR1048304.1 hypothetical protein [Pasteurella multocida]HDR1138960.1 hypothetical protein [Pasteurella multocida]HED4432149.1 hypothetical protein [Pasteurella multocida]HEP0888925.1 hypothetical protein [Pasteurella multocida]